MTDASSASARTAAPRAGGRAGSWQLDPARSVIAIRHKTMWGLVNVKGTFTEVSGQGEILADGSAPAARPDHRGARRPGPPPRPGPSRARFPGAAPGGVTVAAEVVIDRGRHG